MNNITSISNTTVNCYKSEFSCYKDNYKYKKHSTHISTPNYSMNKDNGVLNVISSVDKLVKNEYMYNEEKGRKRANKINNKMNWQKKRIHVRAK